MDLLFNIVVGVIGIFVIVLVLGGLVRDRYYEHILRKYTKNERSFLSAPLRKDVLIDNLIRTVYGHTNLNSTSRNFQKLILRFQEKMEKYASDRHYNLSNVTLGEELKGILNYGETSVFLREVGTNAALRGKLIDYRKIHTYFRHRLFGLSLYSKKKDRRAQIITAVSKFRVEDLGPELRDGSWKIEQEKLDYAFLFLVLEDDRTTALLVEHLRTVETR